MGAVSGMTVGARDFCTHVQSQRFRLAESETNWCISLLKFCCETSWEHQMHDCNIEFWQRQILKAFSQFVLNSLLPDQCCFPFCKISVLVDSNLILQPPVSVYESISIRPELRKIPLVMMLMCVRECCQCIYIREAVLMCTSRWLLLEKAQREQSPAALWNESCVLYRSKGSCALVFDCSVGAAVFTQPFFTLSALNSFLTPPRLFLLIIVSR